MMMNQPVRKQISRTSGPTRKVLEGFLDLPRESGELFREG